MRTRTYKHEDNGAGANIFYHVSLEEYDKAKPYLILGFEKNQNEIYHDSKRNTVIFPPDFIEAKLDFYQTRKIMGIFVESVSTYMSSIRNKLYQSNTLKYEFEPEGSEYRILLQAVNKKYSNKGDSKNSARLLMTFYKKDSDEEVLSIKLKKTKVVVLLQIIKSLYEEYVSHMVMSTADTTGRNLALIRKEDMVAIGEVWIHGREVQKFQDYIERIIFDFKYRVGYGSEMFKYRQVSATFIDDTVSQISLLKYTNEHRIYKNKDGEMVCHDFVVTSEMTANFFLLLPKSIEFNLQDIEVLENRNEEGSLVSEPVVRIDRQRTSSIADGDFILNTIETQLVLSVDKEMKFNAKKRQGKITLSARYRDFMINDCDYKVGRKNQETGLYETVEKLAKVSLDLKLDWLYIFSLCAEAVHSASEMNLNEYGNLIHSWRYEKKGFLGGDQYGLRVLADPGNKAAIVLIIDHFSDEIGELSNSPLPSEGGARMRIPLFKEHVRTILKGLIGLSSQFEDYYWMKKFPVYSDTYDEIKGDMTLGFRRYFHTKMEKEVVSFGLVGKSSQQIYLTDNDRDSLFFSAYNRLMYGRWLQFSGEQISISFDGWLTDRFNEYRIEFNIEDVNGARGSYPALAMLFATSRAKKFKTI